jgi:glucose/mannose-6-phosphate isomerase
MKKIIDSLPRQIQDSLETIRGISIKRKKYSPVLICGMGGSGISGSIAQALYPEIRIITNSDYVIAQKLDPATLAILISYSGNTEETLANYAYLSKRKVDIIIISSNGTLLTKKAIAKIRVPSGFPPRGALGYLFTPIPMILYKCGLIKPNPTKDLSRMALFLHRERSRIIRKARFIARRIAGKLPIIYANSYAFRPVARRWQGQFNENAKVLAHINVIPEMNHNEIVGIGYPKLLRLHSRILFLHDPNAHTRNDLRARLLPRVIKESMPEMVSIRPPGRKLLYNVFWTLWLGDYVSFYYAQRSGVDPLPVRRIDRLKQLLLKY